MKIKSVQINGLIYLEAKAIMKAFQDFSKAIGVPEREEIRTTQTGISISSEIKPIQKEIEKIYKRKKKMGRHAKDCACPKHKMKSMEKIAAVVATLPKNGKEKEPVAA